jgi:hypothetical protein
MFDSHPSNADVLDKSALYNVDPDLSRGERSEG